MEQQNYHSTITANVSAADAYKSIADVGAWWTKSFKGSAENVGDTFTIQFGDTTAAFEIMEAIPGKRSVWKTTDCYLHWLNDKTEWKDTTIEWEISAKDNTTQVDMTHVGLVPGIECFENCQAGWNGYVTGSLQQLLREGTGKPD